MENAIPRSRKISLKLVIVLILAVGIFFLFITHIHPSTPVSEPTETTAPEEVSTVPETPVEEIASSAEITTPEEPPTAKVVYLTFDDGPGPYTAKLLDILKKYNVKATFFVTGRGDDALIKREYDEGHTIALHTFAHDYAYVYSSISNFFTDLYEVQNRVKNITGETSMLIRFPGGSSNTVSASYDGGTHIMSQLVNEVTARGFTYFDWNVSSGDGGAPLSPDDVYDNVTNALKPEYSVVLQHDVKEYSVDAVERIINYGLSSGYTFSRLDSSSFTAHHGVTN